MVEVVAALIWREENNKKQFLICQRPKEKARGLLWEFVGGKVEEGESKEQALIRECKEELDVDVSVGEVFATLTHAYPDLTVSLTLFNSSIVGGKLRLLEHNALAWIGVDEIDNYDFCPADVEILEKIKCCTVK